MEVELHLVTRRQIRSASTDGVEAEMEPRLAARRQKPTTELVGRNPSPSMG